MNLSWNRVIKYLWIVTALLMLPLGLGTCLGDPACARAWDVMPVLLLLSFPSGPPLLLVLAVLFEPGSIAPPLDYSIVWLIAFGAGFLQWFWLVPKLFDRSEITTLGLMSTVSRARTAVSVPTDLPASVPVIKRSRKKATCFVHFDSKGHSPLERVIHRNLQ